MIKTWLCARSGRKVCSSGFLTKLIDAAVSHANGPTRQPESGAEHGSAPAGLD